MHTNKWFMKKINPYAINNFKKPTKAGFFYSAAILRVILRFRFKHIKSSPNLSKVALASSPLSGVLARYFMILIYPYNE